MTDYQITTGPRDPDTPDGWADNGHETPARYPDAVPTSPPPQRGKPGGRFGMIPACAIAPAGRALPTLAAIAAHADLNRLAFPKLATIAHFAGVTDRQVKRHVKLLVEAGLLTSKRAESGPGRRRSNMYRILDSCGRCFTKQKQPEMSPHTPEDASDVLDSEDMVVSPPNRPPGTEPKPPLTRSITPSADLDGAGGGGVAIIEEEERAADAARRSSEGEEPQSLEERAESLGVDVGAIRREVTLAKAQGEDIRSIAGVTRYRVTEAVEMAEATQAEADHEQGLEILTDLRRVGASFGSLAEWSTAIRSCAACDDAGEVHLTGLLIWPPEPRNRTITDDPAATWSTQCPHTAEWQA